MDDGTKTVQLTKEDMKLLVMLLDDDFGLSGSDEVKKLHNLFAELIDEPLIRTTPKEWCRECEEYFKCEEYFDPTEGCIYKNNICFRSGNPLKD